MTTVEPGASEVFTQGLRFRPRSTALLASRPAPIITEGLEVLVQLVIAAITTRPWSSSTLVAVLERHRRSRRRCRCRASRAAAAARAGAACRARRRGPRPAGRRRERTRRSPRRRPLPSSLGRLGVELPHRLEEGVLRVRQRDPVLGALRPGDARLDLAEVELEQVAEKVGSSESGVVEQPLLAGVGVDQLDRLGRAPGELEVAQRLGVDREDRAGRAELRRHVADRRPVGEAERLQPGAEELDELGDDAVLAQHLGHGQDQVGRGRALAAARRRA